MLGVRMITCSSGCAAGLRADRHAGAIYGPYTDGTRKMDGTLRTISMTEFAALSGRCVYCGAPLPAGRGTRIFRQLRARDHALGVA